MNLHPKVQEFMDALNQEFPHLQFRLDGPTVGGHCFIDVIQDGKFIWVLQADPRHYFPDMYNYGCSIIDDDVGFDYHPDLACGHLPTFIKYLKMLLPPKA